jgi:hypothetical protein
LFLLGFVVVVVVVDAPEEEEEEEAEAEEEAGEVPSPSLFFTLANSAAITLSLGLLAAAASRSSFAFSSPTLFVCRCSLLIMALARYSLAFELKGSFRSAAVEAVMASSHCLVFTKHMATFKWKLVSNAEAACSSSPPSSLLDDADEDARPKSFRALAERSLVRPVR